MRFMQYVFSLLLNDNDHNVGETQRSVMQRLGARKGGKIGVVKLERAQNDTATRSIQIFFSHVSRYLNSDDSFDDAIFLMTGVDIAIRDEYDESVGDGNSWDLYAQLDEDRFTIHYWATNSASGNHVAYANIPKFSDFIHFSPCGNSFVTLDISSRDTGPNNCKVTTSFCTVGDVVGKR